MLSGFGTNAIDSVKYEMQPPLILSIVETDAQRLIRLCPFDIQQPHRIVVDRFIIIYRALPYFRGVQLASLYRKRITHAVRYRRTSYIADIFRHCRHRYGNECEEKKFEKGILKISADDNHLLTKDEKCLAFLRQKSLNLTAGGLDVKLKINRY